MSGRLKSQKKVSSNSGLEPESQFRASGHPDLIGTAMTRGFLVDLIFKFQTVKYSILLLVFIILSCSPKKEKAGITLSKIKLETLEGKAIDLTDYEGKTIFLNFWATWCGPCLQEMPSIERAMNELHDPNIVFLFVSDEETDRIRSFQSARKFKFNYVRALNVTELNIQALPTTFIFNPDGDLIFNELGYRDWSTDQNKNLIQGKLVE